MANYVFKLDSKCILCSPEKNSTTNLMSLSSFWKQANQRLMTDCVPCETTLSKRLPGPVRAEGKQALGWASPTIPQCTIQHQEKPCLIFSAFYPITPFFFFFFLLLSTSVHSPLVSLMFLPLPFFGPSPPWLSAKPLTEGLWSFFNPPGTWHANTTIILIILPLTAFSSGHCHSWQSFSLSHAFFAQ